MYKWLEPPFRSASCEECSRTGGKPGLREQCRVLEAGLPDLGWSRVLKPRCELPAGCDRVLSVIACSIHDLVINQSSIHVLGDIPNMAEFERGLMNWCSRTEYYPWVALAMQGT